MLATSSSSGPAAPGIQASVTRRGCGPGQPSRRRAPARASSRHGRAACAAGSRAGAGTARRRPRSCRAPRRARRPASRSEEHTSELQSRQYLVCRLLLEKKKKHPTKKQNKKKKKKKKKN